MGYALDMRHNKSLDAVTQQGLAASPLALRAGQLQPFDGILLGDTHVAMFGRGTA